MDRPSEPNPLWSNNPATPLVVRVLVLIVVGWFTFSHLFLEAEWVFIDGVNLALHEGGHLIFAWAPQWLAILGGTLGQLAWPVVFALYFRRRGQHFAVLVMIWWMGENAMNIARYLEDAQVMMLPLVGGEIHDWNYLLGRSGLLPHTHRLAKVTRFAGAVVMLVSYAALVRSTGRQYREETDPAEMPPMPKLDPSKLQKPNVGSVPEASPDVGRDVAPDAVPDTAADRGSAREITVVPEAANDASPAGETPSDEPPLSDPPTN